MFSGGLDSTACLRKLLTEDEYSGYKIHVHHIHIINVENRHAAESIAVSRIVEYFDKNDYRDFDYSESTILIPAVNSSILYDSDIYRFTAGYMASSSDGQIKHVAYGRNQTDIDEGNLGTLVNRGEDIFKIFTEGSDVSEIFPVLHMRKRDIINYLSDDLVNLTWYCRRPTYIEGVPQACGKCKTYHHVSD